MLKTYLLNILLTVQWATFTPLFDKSEMISFNTTLDFLHSQTFFLCNIKEIWHIALSKKSCNSFTSWYFSIVCRIVNSGTENCFLFPELQAFK